MRRLISRILHATNGLALCHLDTKAGGSKKSDEMASQSTTVSQVARKEDLEEFRRQKRKGLRKTGRDGLVGRYI